VLKDRSFFNLNEIKKQAHNFTESEQNKKGNPFGFPCVTILFLTNIAQASDYAASA
jgi:hypothetical protein